MIRYDAAAKIFTLSTPHTSYQMKTDADGRLLHTWYGGVCLTAALIWPNRVPRTPILAVGLTCCRWNTLPPARRTIAAAPSARSTPMAPKLPICGTHPTRSCPASTACPLCLLFGKMQTPRAFALRCGTPPVCRSSFGMLCIRTATSLPVPPS